MSTHSDPYAAARLSFFAEARELLVAMEDALLQLESTPGDSETINALFRAAHTIKGSGGMFELKRIVAFTHVVESVLERVRSGKLGITPELIALLLRCGDHIGLLLAEAQDPDCSDSTLSANSALSDTLSERLAHYLEQAVPQATPLSQPLSPSPQTIAEPTGGDVGSDNWHISVRFGPDLLRSGMDPLAILRYLATLGRLVSVHTLFDAMPDADSMDPESCYLGFEIELDSPVERPVLMAAFDFVRDDCALHILPPNSRAEAYIKLIEALPEDPLRLGEILVRCGCLSEPELAQGLQRQHECEVQHQPQPLGEVLLAQQAVQVPVLNAALEKQQKMRERQTQENHFIRVRADKLDRLINLVGELVVACAGVSLRVQHSTDSGLQEVTQMSAGLVEQIRDEALQLRMVPIADTFNRFNRLVRDTSRELGKDIALALEGGENELDKSMVEKLLDPLTHLVRNAMDHGIEPPADRLAAAKPAQGTITLAARHESGSFVIEVADDGGGLKRDRILAKAVAQGLTPAGKEHSDEEIYQYIFAAGFSTAEAVTNLSGRGVGMDVVRRNIEALRGSVVVTSQAGVGTCFTLRLPLTLAIIDGFLVGVEHAQYVIPLNMVVECVELSEAERAQSHGRNFINLRGEVLPFLRLRELFGLTAPPPQRENVVVVQFGAQRAGLVVDELRGEFQTVIKPLSRLFASLRGISGSTILGSGEVALILDVPALIQRCSEHEMRMLELGQTIT